MNLFALDLKTEAVRQLTFFRDFDVRSPSLGPDAIVFERAGALFVLDLASEKCEPLMVRLPRWRAATQSPIPARRARHSQLRVGAFRR
jgi:tricorn protease-like protein